jgi:hypothetical protein
LLFAPHGLNNPSRYTDPSGHRICDRPDSKECLSDPGDYGISFDGDYSSHERSFIKRAVEDVAYAIWAESDFETPWEAFQSVYKNLTFGKCGQGNYKSYSCSAFGWTLGRSTILFGGFYKSIERNVRLTVHELAHAFDHYVCQTSGVCDESDMGVGSARHDLQGKLHGCTPTVADGSDCLGRVSYTNDIDRTNPYWGFAGKFNDWQFAVTFKDQSLEVFADMFLGWTYNTWGPGMGGANRRYYMNNMMPVYLNR